MGLQFNNANSGGVDLSGEKLNMNGLEHLKSIEGFIFFLNGTPISWSSKKQGLVAPSSTCAEYVALDRAVKEALFIANLMKEMGIRDEETVELRIHSDNAAFLTNAATIAYKPSPNFLDIRFQFVRDEVKKRTVRITVIASGENLANGLTKALDPIKFECFKALMGLKK
ncbi:hypothetical protein N7454_003325 [Penicillium verhagenii]|nr:hypothetical protein N7454_003325 [Penicillium verhagenii]